MSLKSRTIPNFFTVGKPKSGTTALHQLLAQHPEIFMSPEKEPHHFHLEYLEAGTRRKRVHIPSVVGRRRGYCGQFDTC